jgi:hypothetical protein
VVIVQPDTEPDCLGWHRVRMPSRSYAAQVTDSPEVDAIVPELERAGLATIGRDADGRETWTLTAQGAQVARQPALNGRRSATR